MALTSKSLFLYNFEITQFNGSIDFRAMSGGPVLTATLQLGFYSLSALAQEIKSQMGSADPNNKYTVTINRDVAGGVENRVTISTDGTYLDLLFSSGAHHDTTVATLIGFNQSDYTGMTSYTSSASAGTVLIPDFVGYNYTPEFMNHKVFGSVNVAASGEKEAVVFQIQKFIMVEYKYEQESNKANVHRLRDEWQPFMDWAIQQRLFEFTPEISSPDVVYEVTLEKTQMDQKGLSQTWREMLPQFPTFFQSGPLTFRVRPAQTEFTF